MVEKKLLNQIFNDFSVVIKKKDILGIFLFGSYRKSQNTNRSDVDICIVAPNEKPHELISFILQNINIDINKYDIRLFSELPLYIKVHIMEDGILIYSPNELDLFEFFYLYQKLWDDQKHRQEISKEDLMLFLK